MMLSPFHLHCTFCDGKNTPEEMILEAMRLGCPEIGFSSHAFMAHESRWGMPPDVEKKYKAEILRLKDKYSGEIKVFMGIEYDWYSDFDISDYDYIIGSVHYIKKGDYFIPLDETADHHKAAIKEFYGGDADALAEEYYSMVSRLYEKMGCDIVAHIDLITKFNEREEIYTETERYKSAAIDACTELSKKPVVFEINTGAISRGYRTTPYPAPFILDTLIGLGASLVITPDAHNKESILCRMKECAEQLESMKYPYLKSMEEVLKKSRKK